MDWTAEALSMLVLLPSRWPIDPCLSPWKLVNRSVAGLGNDSFHVDLKLEEDGLARGHEGTRSSGRSWTSSLFQGKLERQCTWTSGDCRKSHLEKIHYIGHNFTFDLCPKFIRDMLANLCWIDYILKIYFCIYLCTYYWFLLTDILFSLPTIYLA